MPVVWPPGMRQVFECALNEISATGIVVMTLI